MAINWKLKTYLATKHGIYGATALQKQIIKKTGVIISIQNLCNYIDKKPKAIRLKTIEIVCKALSCELKDFCEVKTELSTNPGKESICEIKKLSYQNTPHSKRAFKNFPDPKDYS